MVMQLPQAIQVSLLYLASLAFQVNELIAVGSEGGRRQKVVSEQGVDEILQMKMLESLVDTKEPATIVLASGDAAEAEYSGGFLKNVERALEKGWHVELVSWRCGLSRDYRSSKFTTKWKGQFTIVELDDFSEELLAIHTDSVRAAIQVWPY
jgi:hypothetical protein